MENTVYIVRCQTYDQAEEKVAELLEMMGGINRFVKKDEKIILKANLLRAANPDKMVTTHPSIIAAVGRLARTQGAKPIIADSPGSGYAHSKQTLQRLYRKCGLDEAAHKAGIDTNLDTSYQVVSYPDGGLIKRFEVIRPILEANGVMNLCKLKTHSFMRMTGAVKNIFGVIHGRAKPGYHAKLSDTAHFANMLLDLANCISPRLSIMDAVVGMEGNGPSGGNPREIGLLIGATNPLALDVVAGEIMGLDRTDNPILIEAEKRGMNPTRFEEIELIDASASAVRIPDFKLPSTLTEGSGFERFPSWMNKTVEYLFKNAASLKPKINKKNCIACGACRDACPVHVIDIVDNRYARIHTKNCIRCYCCHEMCPENAIDLTSGILYRILYG
jgi:uncharacterized protein (DUF362 family)/ferredoxin